MQSQRLKILLTHRFHRGGGFTVAHYLCNALVGLGHEVDCIYIREKLIGNGPVMPADVRYNVIWLETFLVIQPWQVKRFVKRYIKTKAVDSIISTGPEGCQLQGLCSKEKILHIASYHVTDPSYKVRLVDLFSQLRWLNPLNLGKWCQHLYIYFEWIRLKSSDMVHCISEYQKALVIGYLNIPEEKIVMIYIGVDTKLFSPQPDIERSGIIYCGRVIWWKGTDDLLEALSIVRTRHAVSLTIIGPGDWEPYKRKAEALGIDRHVHYVGYIPYEEIGEYFKRAYIFVNPTEIEAFGLSNVEAMASGLPVISTLSSSIPEVVEDGVTGILVPWNDSRALADAIIKLLDNPRLAESMGKMGRICAEKKFSWEQAAKSLINAIVAQFHIRNS